jgi:hypothetical protein
VAVAPAAPASQLPATTAPQPVSKIGPSGLVLGDKIPDFKDIILPRINLVQNIGELKESFSPGMVVLGRQTVVFTPPKMEKGVEVAKASAPAVIVVLGFRPTRFSEKVVGGVQGLTLNSEAEVAQNGGTLDHKEFELKKASGMKLFQPLADALVAVQRPDDCADDDTVFGYDVDGKKYALALWAMKGTAYTEAAKRVFFTGRAVGILKKGYPTYSFTIATREKPYPNGNKAWIPVCLPGQKTSPAFLNFVASVLGAPETEAAS